MPGFNADEYAAAREPWRVTIDGVEHVGQPVSQEALLRFYAAYDRAEQFRVQSVAKAAKLGPDILSRMTVESNRQKQERCFTALRLLLRAAFPAKWRYLIRPKDDPVQQVLGLDVKTLDAALISFFDSLGLRWPSSLGTNGPNGSGTFSAAPTP